MRTLIRFLAPALIYLTSEATFADDGRGHLPERATPVEETFFIGTRVDSIPEAIVMLNNERARRGLGPVFLDESLQGKADEKASRAARLRHRGHLGGSLGGANYEGIGYSSRKQFLACYAWTSPAGTRVGASIRQGSDGWWYSCLLVRHSGRLQAKPGTGSSPSRRVFRFRR